MKPSRKSRPQEEVEEVRTGLGVEALKHAFRDNLFYIQGRRPRVATRNDLYMAVAYSVRDRLLRRVLTSLEKLSQQNVRVVCYFSAEFLLGPHLGNNLLNLGITEAARKALAAFKIDLDDLLAQEEEPGLGNGGLGRLAACYLDSLATLEVPAIGYGIRYEFGIFDQEIHDGWQVERTDKWLHLGNPWEIARPEVAYEVKLGGHTEAYQDEEEHYCVRWTPERVVKGIAYDTLIPGYGVDTCSLLRLWNAEAAESFDFAAFNVGDYYGAVEEKMASENISKVLYPNDEALQGKQLRLEQQYFFVSCSLQDMIRLHRGKDLKQFHETFTAQLNDTHPSIAVAELMRLLVDEQRLDWDTAWEITRNTLAYTNHTLLPEALEKWSLPLFARVLPRHLEIIYEINRRFLDDVRERYPGDEGRAQRLSLIDESGERAVRMANLACVGSHAVNGVEALHTELLKQDVLRDFHDLWPEKFSNKTNGVTPRRFLVLSNPPLTRLITDTIGDRWITHLDELRRLEAFADKADFQRRWRRIKLDNKHALAMHIRQRTGIEVNPASLFDIQAKRLHEYKRQHLNMLYVMTLYNRLKRDPTADVTPRTVIFGGKAAPGYVMARLIIKLITSVAEVANVDPEVGERLKVVFFPNFNVQSSHWVYPAADLSEQISTAGKEASGTGNMKFAMNGALTIGTLDGANVEIREEVGADNFFLFGLTAEQVAARKTQGYRPREYYEANPHLHEVLDQLSAGVFSGGDTNLFKPLVDSLLDHDPYMLLADYQAYVDCQDRVDAAYRDARQWTRMSILNVARIGKFSSDRAIREYCEDIWRVRSLP
jgi:starch phosphorylase